MIFYQVHQFLEVPTSIAMLMFVQNREIYEKVILSVAKTKKFLWIATADIKDMYVENGCGNMVPFLEVLANLLSRGVEIRLIHAKEPGIAFRKDFDKYPNLWHGIERVLCPRIHFKCIIIDGTLAYFGSANLTGAGMGAKGINRRNFENGILTDLTELIEPLSNQYDLVWLGKHCKSCARKQYCTDCPIK